MTKYGTMKWVDLETGKEYRACNVGRAIQNGANVMGYIYRPFDGFVPHMTKTHDANGNVVTTFIDN